MDILPSLDVDLRIELTRKATLVGAIKHSIEDRVIPLPFYFNDHGPRRKAEWEITGDIYLSENLYLKFELETIRSTPPTLPLVIRGAAGLIPAHTERGEVPKRWKEFIVKISEVYSISLSDDYSNRDPLNSEFWFDITILEPTAELPERVAKFFNARGGEKQIEGPVIKEATTLSDSDHSPTIEPAHPDAVPDINGHETKKDVAIRKLFFDPLEEGEGHVFVYAPPPLDDLFEQAHVLHLDSPPRPDAYFPVWYATNRQGLRNEENELVNFSGQYDTATTSYGKCLVRISAEHVIGETRANLLRRVLLALTLRRDKSALHLVDVQPAASTTAYWEEIRSDAAKWPSQERCALIFLHGYNVSFERAAIVAAQIGYDLQVQGPVGFFSWPSRGSLLGYAADEAAIEASEAQITQYLLDFARESQVERIHIIAHSMGNRGLLRALQRIAAGAATDAPKIFEQIILAAPDVDKALFLSLAAHYNRLGRHTTLYVSNKDLALASSRMLRIGMARVGLAPPVTIAPNIDTVHVAHIDMTLLGHGYVAETRGVLTDIHQLIFQNASPDKRMGLRPAEEKGHRYWVIGA